MFAAVLATLIVQAAPGESDVACIVNAVPANLRASLLTEAASGQPGPVHTEIRRATDSCARERGWTTEIARSAGLIALAAMAAEDSGRILNDEGVPAEWIDDWFEQQPTEAWRNPNLGNEVGEQLVRHLESLGLAMARIERNLTNIGIYLGARHLIAHVRAGTAD
jgi:hypothetical protein